VRFYEALWPISVWVVRARIVSFHVVRCNWLALLSF
jgi:hypothetical protein